MWCVGETRERDGLGKLSCRASRPVTRAGRGQRLQPGLGGHFTAEGVSELSFGGRTGFSLGILS